MMRDYMRFYFNEPGWEHILDAYNVNAAILPKNSLGAIHFFDTNARWRKVFEGGLDVVYIKNAPRR
jgi:hypothetical protein